MGNIEPQTGLGETSSRAEGIAFTQIPDHELIRQIGGGSYGEVWLARSALGTYRAVKIVYRKHFSHDRPFEREFSGIQKYEPVSRAQPGLMDILQAGRNDQAGYFYYVMELADDVSSGQQIDPANYTPHTLSHERSKRGRLPFEECLNIGLTLTSALGHLHKNGLVHRDIKPSNIIFVNGVAELADIGLVTDIEEARSYVGTEGFIAPEGPGTPRADIYSLGKVLYEISTGKDRFDYPELPTTLDDTTSRQELIEFNEIILKACRTDPRDRYPSAEKMNADLLLLQRGRSIKQVRKLQRRLALATRVGIAAVAAALLTTGAWIGSIKQIQRARRAEQKAGEVSRFLVNMLSGVGPSAAKGRDTVLLREILDSAANRVEKELKKEPEVQIELLSTLGESYTAIGLHEKAGALHRRALELQVAQGIAEDPNTAKLRRKLAVNLWFGKKFDEAESVYRELIDEAIRFNGRESLAVATLKKECGSVLLDARRIPAAELMEKESLEIRLKLLGRTNTEVAESMNELAAVYYSQQRYAESEKLQREALAIQKALVGEQTWEVATFLGNLACTLMAQGKFAEAIRTERRAVEKACTLFGPEDTRGISGKLILGKMLLAAGLLEEAETILQETLCWFHDRHEHLWVANNLDAFGQLRLAQGRLVEAETNLLEALRIRQKDPGDENYLATLTLNNLGSVLARQGRPDQAEDQFRRALTIQRKLLRVDDLDLAVTLEHLGLALLAQQETTEAEMCARECLQIREKRWPDNWRRFSCQALLGACLLQGTNYAAAQPLLESGYDGLEARANTIPFNSKCRLRAALQDLLRVYEATDQRHRLVVLSGKLAQLEE